MPAYKWTKDEDEWLKDYLKNVFEPLLQNWSTWQPGHAFPSERLSKDYSLEIAWPLFCAKFPKEADFRDCKDVRA